MNRPLTEPQRRLQVAAELHSFGVSMVRQRFVRRNPDASAEQLDQLLTAWLHEQKSDVTSSGYYRLVQGRYSFD